MSQVASHPGDPQRYINNIDPDDQEYIRQLRRPADVKEDVRQMEERSRVKLILKSDAFRKELEELVSEQLVLGPRPTGLVLLQHISQVLQNDSDAKKTVGAGGDSVDGSNDSSSITPVNDLKGLDLPKVEKAIRCKLAALYRLADLFGWSRGIHSYITVRLAQEGNFSYLMASQEAPYSGVTAASLVKLDASGKVIDVGTGTSSVDRSCHAIHVAIHDARSDLRCIIHLRSPVALAISVLGNGLLPITPEAIAVGDASVIDLSEFLPLDEKQNELANALGSENKVFIVKNLGIMVGGETVEEAFILCKNVITAAEAQLLALPVGVENIAMPSKEVRENMKKLLSVTQPADGGRRKWMRGEMEFEALMRQLDSAGYQTGYSYREPFIKREHKPERINSDVEVPPSYSSVGTRGDGQLSPKRVEKTDALTKFTPNSYRKEETAEGAPGPDHLGKKFTRWIPEESGVNSVIKVENPNQFALLSKDSKEYKNKYQEIRKEYYTDKLSAGPQSKILDGMTWEEAQAIQEGRREGPKDTVIVVGAASVGVLKRDHQHDPNLYQVYYPPNPFDNVTTQEIEDYTSDIERKRRAGFETDTTDTEGPGRARRGKGMETDTTDTEGFEEGPEGRLVSSQERQKHSQPPQARTSTVAAEEPSSPTKVAAAAAPSPAKAVSPAKVAASPPSPTKSASDVEASTSAKKEEKKKKKFHLPSFGKKDKKEKKEKAAKE